MNRTAIMIMITITLFIAIVAGSAPAVVSAQSGFPSSPALPAGCPSVELWQNGSPKSAFGADIRRRIFCRTPQKLVELEWRQTSQPLPTNAVPENTRTSIKEVFATSYWPTFVQLIDSYHWCVAGKGRNGDVVIESWTFAPTIPLGTPAPSVIEHFLIGSSEPYYYWTLPPRIAVSEIQRAVATSTGLVRALFRDPASNQHVYVWYDGSRSVCRVNLSTGSLAPVAAPVASTGILGVPQLSGNYDTVWSADYAQHGFCLILTQTSPSGVGSALNTLVLIDANRDGKLDSASELTGPAWSAGGWDNPANITTLY